MPFFFLFFRAPRLATLAVGLSATSPRSEGRGHHSRRQELPPVALPLLVPIVLHPYGLSAAIPGTRQINTLSTSMINFLRTIYCIRQTPFFKCEIYHCTTIFRLIIFPFSLIFIMYNPFDLPDKSIEILLSFIKREVWHTVANSFWIALQSLFLYLMAK